MAVNYEAGRRAFARGAARAVPECQDIRARVSWLQGYDAAALDAQIDANRKRMGMRPLREHRPIDTVTDE